jgi:hypothetical protein
MLNPFIIGRSVEVSFFPPTCIARSCYGDQLRNDVPIPTYVDVALAIRPSDLNPFAVR